MYPWYGGWGYPYFGYGGYGGFGGYGGYGGFGYAWPFLTGFFLGGLLF